MSIGLPRRAVAPEGIAAVGIAFEIDVLVLLSIQRPRPSIEIRTPTGPKLRVAILKAIEP